MQIEGVVDDRLENMFEFFGLDGGGGCEGRGLRHDVWGEGFSKKEDNSNVQDAVEEKSFGVKHLKRVFEEEREE
jgi:hypothetical protein